MPSNKPIPSDSQIQTAVTKALAKRNHAASPVEIDTLFHLVKGKMSLAFATTPLATMAQTMTDILIAGKGNTPPGPSRTKLRSLVKMAFEELKQPDPPPALKEVLVSVAIGWMTDQSLPVLPGAGQAIFVHNVCGLYLASFG